MSASPTHPPSSDDLLTHAHVWVVDDDPLVTTSVEALLSVETDYRIRTFNAPADVLTALHTESDTPQADVIISDFLMPGMDGIQLLSQIKTLLPQATLILLTGYADKENAIAAINEAGIYKYLEKPWDNQDLLHTLEQGIERAYLVRQLEATIGQLEAAQAQLHAHNLTLTDTVAQQKQSLALTHQQLEAIVQGSEDGIATITAKGKVVSCNPAVVSLLNTQAIPTHISNVFDDITELKTNLIQHQKTGTLSQPLFEAHVDKTPVEVTVSPIQGSDAATETRYVLIIRDVTRRKALERLREDFVATLTHDLRVPLLAAIQTLTLMRDGATGELTEQQHTLIATMIDSQQDLLNMVNTLLDIYRYESAQKPLVMDSVDINQLARQVVAELTPLAQSKQQTLMLDFPLNTVTVAGDRQELKRVWINLVGNAIVHTPAGGVITLGHQSDAPNDEVCFFVKDTGQGIPEKDRTQLFERFAQGTSKVRSSGSGLGLYLTQHIMQAHHGRIHVKSETGKGTCFFLRFQATSAASQHV